MTWQVICADVLDGLASLPDASVQTVVTSPPYWGLRDYGTAAWDGGDAACNHVERVGRGGGEERSTLQSNKVTPEKSAKTAAVLSEPVPYRETCGKCGARRVDQQLGLEPTPEAYVERMVEVFRAVRRVLRDDGTVWLNLGDSYAESGYGEGTGSNGKRTNKPTEAYEKPRTITPIGLKPKDLVGIPWRVAVALQADGWYLRSDIIWAKPNPMPESVTDRPTKSHEYVFLLSKSARYFYDADAVRESQVTSLDAMRPVYGPAAGWVSGPQFARRSGGANVDGNPAGRNMRSVWNIATEPFPGAHFATFPKKLVEPCVKAGSATGDTVLDPFCGSGTVGVVSLRLGRSFVGIELNPEYAEMARERIRNDAPLWNHAAEVAAAHTEESG